MPIYAGNRLVRIDPSTNRIAASIPGLYYDVAVGYGSVWAITWRGGPRDWITWGGRTLARVDPRTDKVIVKIDLPGRLFSVAVGGGSVWVSDDDPEEPAAQGSIWRIDPASGHVLARIRLPHAAGHLAFGYGSVWATAGGARLFRIDPRTGRVIARLRTSRGGPINYDYLAIGEGAVWVVNLNNIVDSVLVRVDPATNRATATIALPQGPQGVTTGFGSVWVSFFDSAKVLRFAP